MGWRIMFLFCAGFVVVKAGENYTFTYQMALQCKEHTCKHGYRYETFYRVDSDDRRKIKTDPNVLFEMHIAILGANNGHILLTTVPNPNSTNSVYEIVVGGGGNKFTELRRNLRRNAKDTAKTIGILSAVEFRAFYIRISKDGLVEFGKEGSSTPLLSYYDVNPLSIQYFSFAAWNGVEAKFLYDCPVNGSNSSTTNSEALEPVMSDSDKLIKLKLTDRLPHIPPGKVVDVKLGVKITSVRYDPFDSKLVTGIAAVVSWEDESLAWNPDKYNNITKLNFRDGQIWRPTFFLINADDKGAIDTEDPVPTTVVNSGEATFYFQAELTSWCYKYTQVINRWPHDEYDCSIVLGPWEAHEKFNLEMINPTDQKMAIFADTAKVIPNEWSIKWRQAVVQPSEWEDVFITNDNETYVSDRFLINISLKRKATAYNIVFYTPLIVLFLFILMSFWGEPLQMSRIWFYTGATIVICMGLCYIDYLVPCQAVPTIVILYITVLSGILLALLIQVLLMTETAQKLCKSTAVYSVLTARMFRVVFLLPPVKNCTNYDRINEAYAQEDEDSGVLITSRNGNIEEMETEDSTHGDREELATVLDRLLFVVFTVVFAVMLALHF